MLLDDLSLPIVQAPMAGGPSTLALARAVGEAGGLGFIAGAYRDAEAVAGDIRALRESSARPFGVNVFVPGAPEVHEEALRAYLATIEPDAARYGVAVGAARYDDDGWEEKLAVLREERPAVASFTFGCPPDPVIADLKDRGVSVWVTVTTPTEAGLAARAGADALVVQGAEAGGHQGSFEDGEREPLGLLAVLALVGARVDLPLVASGGITTGAGVAAILAAGASAAQIGTALMLTPEAATRPAHRTALASPAPAELTRAFSGRLARGVRNGFQARHSANAPSAYPQVHHATSPIRAAARDADAGDDFNLWAGQTHQLAEARSTAEILDRLAADARTALARAQAVMGPGTRRQPSEAGPPGSSSRRGGASVG